MRRFLERVEGARLVTDNKAYEWGSTTLICPHFCVLSLRTTFHGPLPSMHGFKAFHQNRCPGDLDSPSHVNHCAEHEQRMGISSKVTRDRTRDKWCYKHPPREADMLIAGRLGCWAIFSSIMKKGYPWPRLFIQSLSGSPPPFIPERVLQSRQLTIIRICSHHQF